MNIKRRVRSSATNAFVSALFEIIIETKRYAGGLGFERSSDYLYIRLLRFGDFRII